MKFWLYPLLILLVCHTTAQAQKHDYVWLSGYMGNDTGMIGYYPPLGYYFGTTKLDFNYMPAEASFDSTIKMNFDFTNTSFCDSDGNLLFYTNGVSISNSLDEKIENSDSLNAGYFQYIQYPSIQLYGYRSPQGIITIPSISNKNQYYIFHSFIDSFQTTLTCSKILITLLDISENVNHGKVIFKNRPIIENGFPSEQITAIKHANGISWWVIIKKKDSNCYYRILVDSSGVNLLPDLICQGDIFTINDFVGAATFTSDGSKYCFLCGQAFAGDSATLNIMDFDRCSGQMRNPITIKIPATSNGSGWGIASSPNSRYLYVSFTGILYQFDLSVEGISNSITIVGVYDGTNAPFPAYFHTQQLGPDGKIYMSCGNSDTVYHVIQRPDEKGDSCLFKQHSLSLYSPSIGVPNFPNYRLGALPGSPCDTLTGLNDIARAEKEKLLKVFPNPATNFVTIDYGFTDWNKGEITLEITNDLGQLAHHQPVPMYSGFQKVEVQNFAPGMYTAFIKRKGQVVATAKFARL